MPLLPRLGGCLHYEVSGPEAAPPLILLRGLGRSVRHWLGFDQQLTSSYRVITIELRGIGQSTTSMEPTTDLFELADDIIAVLDALKLQRAHILGISLGGMVALACGIKHTQRCLSLIVVNTSIAGLHLPRITLSAIRAITIGLAVGLRQDKERIHRELVDVLVGSDCTAEHRQKLIMAYSEIATEDGLYVYTAIKQLVAAARFLVKPQLRALKLPVLVIYGTGDRFVPHANSRKLATLIPHATLRAIQNGGHELPLDKPQELQNLLDSWFQQLG